MVLVERQGVSAPIGRFLRDDRGDGQCPASHALIRFCRLSADSGTVKDKRALAFALATVYLVGMATFVGVRWGSVSTEMTTEWPSVLWFALPLAATYTGAAAMGVILVRDGVTRWWWLPAVLFIAIGLPVEGWVQGSSFLATRLAPILGSAFDVLVILAPAAVLFARARGPRVEIHGRVVPVVAVSAASVALAMLLGPAGADVSLSVGVALLTFGTCSQSSSWRRAAAFVVIAMALGAQVPASFANAASQGFLGPIAFRDSSVEVVVACLCFAIAPLSRAWGQLLARRAEHAIVAEA